MHRMSPLDASFLHIENDVTHMHIGSVAIFEGPPPAALQVLGMVAAKLPLIPRYRQRVHFVPLGLGRPVWVDDPHFNLAYHVRRTALPAPGGDAELRALVGRVMSQALDRAKPLWELWIAEGLEHGRWALISKVHHCMVDGVSGTELMTVLLDSERDPAPAPRDDWRPEGAPSGLRLVAGALAHRASSPYEAVRTARAATRAPRAYGTRALDAVRGAVRYSDLARPTPASTLNGSVGPHRRWAWARARLSDVKVVRGAFGGTVNDVVLAAITQGFRSLLLERGEPTDRVVRTLVPVSVRAPGSHGEYDNRVSAMFAELPVGIEDPVERLLAIHAQMEALKASKEAVAGEVLTSLSGFAPSLLLALAERMGSRLPQRSVNTVTTNVPGPQRPLYAAGRRMLEALPYVPLGGHVRVGVAIFSYDGALTFGVTGDWDTAADIEVLCRGIERGMADLVSAAAPSPRRTARGRSAAARPG
jgi:diacylglycerol O-acyltransferase